MKNLHERLLAKTHGKANESNIIIENNVRITVLSDILIRIETGAFTDLPSQTVWYRNSDKVNFKTEKNSIILNVITDKATFAVNTKSGKFLYAVIDGVKQKYDRDLNLKGTTRTLDQTFGAVPLKDGVLSQNGVTVMDDSKTLLLREDGKLENRKKGSSDKYVFAYGKDNVGCLNAFYGITGKAPLIPRFALGNWWSRYRAYTQKEYEDLMDEFIRRDIPLTVATVDMDWHWVNVEEKFNYSGDKGFVWKGGWTGYSWNTDLFPDYKGFLKGLHERDLKVTLNLHPADGVRPFDDMYSEMCEAVGQDKTAQKPVEFDLTDSTFINAYFDVLHHPYEKQGVDFWWIDWQQGTKSKSAGLDPLWLLNHYHYLDSCRDGKRPLILSRYAGLGSHRYPLGFSGDTAINWSVLDFQPYFTANAANCGYTWWSHDIGGHHMGGHDDELYIRWLQFGVFSPIIRLHSTSNDLLGKEPWNFSWEAETIGVEFLRLRHKLIPYIYSMNYRSFNDGRALCEPMYFTYPEEKNAYSVKNEYMFGSELLVCPVTTKLNKKTKTAFTKIWLPKGRWTNIFDGRIYKGGQTVTVTSPINTIPVLAKEGAVIPMSEDTGNSWRNPENLVFDIYRGNGIFKLYEDDGETLGFENGDFSVTDILVNENENTLKISISGGKRISSIPEKRNYTFKFKDIETFEKAEVFVNGNEKSGTVQNGEIRIENISVEDRIEITLTGVTAKKNKPARERVLDCLIKYNGNNTKKSAVYKAFKTDDVNVLRQNAQKVRNKALKLSILEAIDAME